MSCYDILKGRTTVENPVHEIEYVVGIPRGELLPPGTQWYNCGTREWEEYYQDDMQDHFNLLCDPGNLRYPKQEE
jgi:hypothetical protein